VKERLSLRDPAYAELVEKVVELDRERRNYIREIEELRSKRNYKSKEIGRLKKEGKDTADLEEEVKNIKLKIDELEGKLERVNEALRSLILRIPNIPQRLEDGVNRKNSLLIPNLIGR